MVASLVLLLLPFTSSYVVTYLLFVVSRVSWRHAAGMVIYTIVVIVVNLKLAIRTRLWLPLMHIVTWGWSIGLWFPFVVYVSYAWTSYDMFPELYHLHR